eukprot:2814942-Alexandrium_andersonii.AAC.1
MVPGLQLPTAPRPEAQRPTRATLVRALIRATTTTTALGPNGAGAVGPAFGAGAGGIGGPPTGPLALVV